MDSRKQVVVTRSYNKARERLRGYHELIDEKFNLFWRDPLHVSLSLHRLDRIGHRDWWSYYVNKDIRTIVSDQQDSWVVCYVAHHDDAYQWAARHRFTIDLTQGSYSLAPPVAEVRDTIATAQTPEQVFRRPLSGYTAEQMMRLGIPNRDWAELLIQATEEQLEQILQQALDEDWLPEDVIERVMDLALGVKPYKDLLPPQLSVLLPSELFRRRPRDFWSPESEQEIRKAIQSRWQEWIIFLHPAQKAAVERDLVGAIRIGGGAGTGKTVVAAHRTAWLAMRYPNERILLTTFTRVLAENLKQRVEQIIGATTGTLIEISNLHSVAYRLFQHKMQRTETAVEDPNPLLAEAIQRAGSVYDLAFVRPEWETIIEPWNVRTLDAYLQIERIGRKMPLQRSQRESLWPVFEQMWNLLEERRLITYGGMCYAVAEYLNAHPEERYRCVVVDEAQDFGPAELTLIRALAQRDKENTLFLCADSRQRIYRPAVPWIRFGIDTRGRSYTLRINYRTTLQIQNFAESVLPKDIEGIQEDETRILADRPIALMHGVAPEARGYESIQAEMRALKQWIYQCLNENIQPGEIAVFARGTQVLNEIEKMLQEILQERGIRARKLSREMQPVPYELNYGTAHNAKGLEFRAVAVAGVTNSNFPSYAVIKDVTDPAEKVAKENQERQLLYTVCTRARERLYISYSPATRRSAFIQGTI
ncbi:MAG: UvrD-helicase domain-containing protein [Fimbriimonadales bacterium]|nr:UvrD-helicase domain-containing protein [Fimbriimonadales bacterium]